MCVILVIDESPFHIGCVQLLLKTLLNLLEKGGIVRIIATEYILQKEKNGEKERKKETYLIMVVGSACLCYL